MARVELCIVDPQNDFCIPNGSLPAIATGALLVPGAYDDMRRLAGWITKARDKLSDIHVTLDSHHKMDVAHNWFWRDRKGRHPLALGEAVARGLPPTIISSRNVKDGTWRPTIPSFVPRMIQYTEALERGGRHPLIIWDDHCLIGTAGAAVVPELMESLNGWCEHRHSTVDFITKGSNIFTEHYGAFAAEVPDSQDPTTQLNVALLKTLEEADVLIWAGEAASHSLLNSMRQAFDSFAPGSIRKSVLLLDATTCIAGFERNSQSFVAEYQAKGMKVARTSECVV